MSQVKRNTYRLFWRNGGRVKIMFDFSGLGAIL
jgi:hypothetical protein